MQFLLPNIFPVQDPTTVDSQVRNLNLERNKIPATRASPTIDQQPHIQNTLFSDTLTAR